MAGGWGGAEKVTIQQRWIKLWAGAANCAARFLLAFHLAIFSPFGVSLWMRVPNYIHPFNVPWQYRLLEGSLFTAAQTYSTVINTSAPQLPCIWGGYELRMQGGHNNLKVIQTKTAEKIFYAQGLKQTCPNLQAHMEMIGFNNFNVCPWSFVRAMLLTATELQFSSWK